MIWYAPVKEATYPDQDCYSCIHKCPCDAFAKFNDGGPYPPPCDDYELPPDCRECGQRMVADANGNFYCEACMKAEEEKEAESEEDE